MFYVHTGMTDECLVACSLALRTRAACSYALQHHESKPACRQYLPRVLCSTTTWFRIAETRYSVHLLTRRLRVRVAVAYDVRGRGLRQRPRRGDARPRARRRRRQRHGEPPTTCRDQWDGDGRERDRVGSGGGGRRAGRGVGGPWAVKATTHWARVSASVEEERWGRKGDGKGGRKATLTPLSLCNDAVLWSTSAIIFLQAS